MATRDKKGRRYAKLAGLRPGDKVQVDGGFDCMEAWSIKEVHQHKSGVLYINCGKGNHILDGQDDGDGYLVGIYPAP
jgi:hypothetical protein